MKYIKSSNLIMALCSLFVILLISTPVLGLVSYSDSEDLTITRTTAPLSQGRTYYLDASNGNDSWSGMLSSPNAGSTDGPWKTLSHIHRSNAFSAGDKILLKRGCQWNITSEFRFSSSGSSTNPIYLGAYGIGAKPLIDGSGGTDTFTRFIGSYYTLDNWSIQKTISYGFVVENTNVWCRGITLINLEFNYTGRDGIYFSRFQGVSDVLIKNCLFNNSGQVYAASSIAILGGLSHHSFNIEVCNNRMLNTIGDAFTIHEGASKPEQYLGSNISIHDNYIHTSKDDGLDLTTGSNVHVYNNTVINAGQCGIWVAHTIHDAYIYNNFVYDAGKSWGMVIIQSPDISFYNNEVHGKGTAPYLLLINDRNPTPDVNVGNISIFKNTFVYNGESYHGAPIEIANADGGLGSIDFYDNIVSTKQSSMPTYIINFIHSSYTANDNDFNSNGNVFGPGQANFYSNGLGVISWSNWRSLYGYDTSGSNTDPLFGNRVGGDYRLSYLSPCIDNGVSNLSLVVGMDRLGGNIYAQRDVGALEYQPPYSMGIDNVLSPSVITVYEDGKFRYLSDIRNSEEAEFSITPVSSWMDTRVENGIFGEIEITDWNRSGNYFKSWKESGLNEDMLPVDYGIGGHSKSSRSLIIDNRSFVEDLWSDEDGYLEFTHVGIHNSRSFEIFIGDEPIISEIDHEGFATTGELYSLTMVTSDDKGIEDATILYWQGDSGTSNNVSMTMIDQSTFSKTFNYEIAIATDTIEPISIILSVKDSDDHWIRSEVFEIIVIDNDIPVFSKDLTTNIVSTGNEFRFKIEAIDNIGIRDLTLEYNISGDSGRIVSNDGIIDYSILLPNDRLVSIEYSFNATDVNDLWNRTEIRIINADDDELPTIDVMTQHESTIPKEDLLIQFSIMDNIGLYSSDIEFWFGEGEKTIRSVMNITSFTIEIGQGEEGPLYYQLKAQDINGNKNSTDVMEIGLSSYGKSGVIMDLSDMVATTGDNFKIRVSIHDSISIQNIWTNYLLNNKDYNITLLDDGEYFSNNVKIPIDQTGKISYSIGIGDVLGFIFKEERRTIEIIDNDEPLIVHDNSASVGTTGDPYVFCVNAEDNIGIGSVAVNYSVKGIEEDTIVLKFLNGTYCGSIPLPLTDILTFTYQFIVEDIFGNVNNSEMIIVKVIDNDPPEIMITEDHIFQATRGSTHFSVIVTDNIHVDSVFIEYWYPGRNRTLEEMVISTDNYNILIEGTEMNLMFRYVAFDSTGNEQLSDIFLLSSQDNGDGNHVLINPVRLELYPNEIEIRADEKIQFNIKVFDQYGNLLPSDLFMISWNVLSGKGSISETGLFTSNEKGFNQIQVSIGYKGNDIKNTSLVYVINDSSSVDDSRNGHIDQGIESLLGSYWVFILIISIVIIIALVLILLFTRNFRDDSAMEYGELDLIPDEDVLIEEEIGVSEPSIEEIECLELRTDDVDDCMPGKESVINEDQIDSDLMDDIDNDPDYLELMEILNELEI